MYIPRRLTIFAAAVAVTIGLTQAADAAERCVAETFVPKAGALASPVNGTLVVPDGAVVDGDWDGPVEIAPAATAILAGRIDGPIKVGPSARVEIRQRLRAPILAGNAACVELRERATAVAANPSARLVAHERLDRVDLRPAARLTAHDRIDTLNAGPSSRTIAFDRIKHLTLMPAARVTAHARIDTASGHGTVVLHDKGDVRTYTLTVKIDDRTGADATAQPADAAPERSDMLTE